MRIVQINDNSQRSRSTKNCTNETQHTLTKDSIGRRELLEQFPVPIIAPLKIYSLLLCHFFLLSLCCAPSSSPTLLLYLPASKSGDLDGAVNGEPPTQKEGDDDDDASMSMWSVCRPVNVPCVIMKAFRETREVGFSWRCAIIVAHSFTLSSSQRVEIWMAHCW